MIDPKVLALSGYDPEKLRKKFQPDGGEAAWDPKIKELIDLTSSRIREGVNRNLRNARWYWCIDQACDVSQQQVSTTLAKGLISGGGREQPNLMSVVKDWGLTSMLTPAMDPITRQPMTDSAGRPMMKLELPTFFNVDVPICPQYVKIRWATLVEQRDQSPFLKYEAQVPSRENHLRTQIITWRGERMTQDMGYRADFRQEILTMLKYGTALVFAKEPYYRDVQLRQIQNDKGEKTLDPVVVREGIRNDIPHPSRAFIDLAHRVLTVNTDTGVQYAGYWDIHRYGDILTNKRYWFTAAEKESGKAVGSMSWIEHSAWDLYTTMYPCTITMPDALWDANSQRSDVDRSSEAYRYTYTKHDQGTVVAKLYQKINPKQFGLFDYDAQIWWCFHMINDRTPILIEPFCYNPVRACPYDADQNLWRISSMVTDIIPYQDQLSNLFSQFLLTIRRNLVNIIWYNKDAVGPEVIERLNRMGKELYTDLNFVPISFRDMSYEPTAGEPQNLFRPVAFAYGNVSDIMQGISTTLDMVERILGFTAQETGSTARHVQTAEEIKVNQTYTSKRVALTDSFIDSSIQAWKEQIYAGFMAYGDDLVMAQVADLDGASKEALDNMGFEIEEGDGKTYGVIGPKSALTVSAFASDREGVRRGDDAQLAMGLMQFAQTVFSVPQVVDAMGTEGIVDAFNTIAQFSGLPKNVKIRPPSKERQQLQEAAAAGGIPPEMAAAAAAAGGGGGAPPQGGPPQGAPPQEAGPSPDDLMARVQEMVGQMQEQQMGAFGETIKTQVVEPLQEMIQQVQQAGEGNTQQIQQLMQAIEMIMGRIAALPQMPMPPIPMGGA